ncbi:MAG: hypothetical protein ABEL04_00800 [Salinibacter sp.]|uniref:hypothetical protein n=1 Tax=Salinibacter sp. TaxID=2065818 RepID=UPI0035D499A2
MPLSKFRATGYARLAMLLVLLGVIAACAAGVNSSARVQSRADGFRELPSGTTVAVLPPTGKGPAARQAIGRAIDSTLQARGGLEVVGPREVQSTLNEEGLVDAYQNALRGYQSTGMMDQEALGQVFEALGAGYLIQLSAGQFQSEAEAETNVVTDEVEAMKSKQARVVGRVWAPGRAQPVWTASARASAKESEFTTIEADRARFYFRAATDLIKKLP